MTYVVVNPYWNVPESIARREIAPEAARDPSYLAARRYQVVSGWGDGDVRPVEARSVDWASVADGGSFPFRLRQLPGPGNALGRIKFMLPNPYDVYLHDTPATHLFTRARRTFSHGCVRVAHPLELAQWAFRGDPRWNRARLASAVASGRRESIALPRPIPVYLLYWTAWADSDGSVHFRDDVYGRDRALSEALGFGEDAEESAPPSGPVRSARLDASRVGAEPAW
jgi:murein L,D-transpeptidase YcbB/YkuD